MKYKQKLQYIRSILLDVWDPIGVSGIDQAASEYDSYAQSIRSMIEKRCTEDDIFNYLTTLEIELRITGDEKKRRVVAKRLAELTS